VFGIGFYFKVLKVRGNMSEEIFNKQGTADLCTISGQRLCVKSGSGYAGLTVVTLEDITAAVKTVEKIHKMEFTNINDFIYENKDHVINGVQKFVDNNHLEDYELAVQTIFNGLDNIGEWAGFLVEVVKTLVDALC